MSGFWAIDSSQHRLGEETEGRKASFAVVFAALLSEYCSAECEEG
ncbi:hypothetical protein [Natronosalvus rutilus]|nr:hypothetical protein [Natronosalvus rutilus]